MPKQWSHGDPVPASEMNEYSTTLEAIHGAVEDIYVQPLAPGADDAGNVYVLQHVHRWLHFESTGVLSDWDEVETTPLAPDSTYDVYDLDSVEWLTYGQWYKVTGCEMACEDTTP